MIIALCVIAWYVSGVLSFIYWWTRDFDFTSNDVAMALSIGVFGPITFIYGWGIHHKSADKVILRKRKS